MKKYICDCCGGQINPATMKCEYCGTQFREDLVNESVVRIESYKNPVQTIKATTIVADEMIRYLGVKEASERAVRILTNELSKGIAPYMAVQSEFDPCRYQHKVSASLKVIVPENGLESWGGMDV